MLRGVDSKTVDFVGSDEVFDPDLELSDDRRVLGVDVDEGEFSISEPAETNEGIARREDRERSILGRQREDRGRI